MRFCAEHIPHKKKKKACCPTVNIPMRHFAATIGSWNSMQVEWRTKFEEKKKKWHCWFFFSGVSMSRNCALSHLDIPKLVSRSLLSERIISI